MWMSHGGSAITTANFPRMDTSKYLMSQQIHCGEGKKNKKRPPHFRKLRFRRGPASLPPHLRGKQLPHVAVAVPCPQAELRRAGLGPQQAALGLWGAVDLVVDVFAGVHMETGVEEGAVAETLVGVFVDDAAGCRKTTH